MSAGGKILAGFGGLLLLGGIILMLMGIMMYFTAEKSRKEIDGGDGLCPTKPSPAQEAAMSGQCKAVLSDYPKAIGQLAGGAVLVALGGIALNVGLGMGKNKSSAPSEEIAVTI